jgi:hypothetical protein
VPNAIASRKWRNTPDRVMVGAKAFLSRARRFRQMAQTASIQDATYMEPDIGAVSYYSGLTIVDMGKLADIHLARFNYYPLFFRQYVFKEQRPDFIHTHEPWTGSSKLVTYLTLSIRTNPGQDERGSSPIPSSTKSTSPLTTMRTRIAYAVILYARTSLSSTTPRRSIGP